MPEECSDSDNQLECEEEAMLVLEDSKHSLSNSQRAETVQACSKESPRNGPDCLMEPESFAKE